MPNTLLENVEYKIDRTNFGTWRRYGYDNGTSYHEFTSHASLLGLPLVHYTYGRNPETGRRVVAKGVFALGRLSCGIFAVGHASLGLFAIGQLALGGVIGLGQLTTGLFAIGQGVPVSLFALAQFGVGYVIIAQMGIGIYVLGQIGLGQFLWTTSRSDSEAVEFFKSWLPFL